MSVHSSKKFIIRLAYFLVLAPAVFAGLLFSGYLESEREAVRSLDVLMRDHLHADYRVEAVGRWEPQILFGDPSFAWKVDLLGGNISDELNNSGVFGAADRADYEYYTKRRIPSDFSIDGMENIGNYSLVRTGIVLGEGTLCPRINCGIEILSGDGYAYIFIAAF